MDSESREGQSPCSPNTTVDIGGRYRVEVATLNSAALAPALRDWQIFPLWGVRNGICACPKGRNCRHPGKHPLTCHACGLLHGLKHASTEWATIEAWWSHHPDANIGGATGKRSGLDVVDVDRRHGGDLERTLHSEIRIFDTGHLVLELPRTRLHETGNGWHVIVAAGSVPAFTRSDAVHLKSDGGHIVLPGSLHANGKRYQVLDATPPWRPSQADAAGSRERCDGAGSKPSKAGRKTRSSVPRDATFAAIERGALLRQGTKRGVEIEFSCPFHDDQHPSAHYNVVKRAFSCKACGAFGGWKKLATALSIPVVPATQKLVAELRAEVGRRRWPGIGGGTEKTLIFDALNIAETKKTRDVVLSARGTADRIGVTKEAASRAVQRLCDVDRTGRWLKRVCPTCRSTKYWTVVDRIARRGPKRTRCTVRQWTCTNHARPLVDGVSTHNQKVRKRTGEVYFEGYIYRLVFPQYHATRCIHTLGSAPPVGGSVYTSSHALSHDAFRWVTGLGKIASTVLTALEDRSWPSARALGLANNLNPRTVQALLPKMEAVGLSARLSSGGWRRGPNGLDAAAHNLGSYGKGVQQEERHRHEREAYERKMEERLKTRPRQAEEERRQSAEAFREVPPFQWALSGDQTGQRLVAWLIAVQLYRRQYQRAA